MKTPHGSSRPKRRGTRAVADRLNRQKKTADNRSGNGQVFAVPRAVCIPALIFATTVAVFLPSLKNDFVDWDDYRTLVENQSYRGLGWEQIRWMFTTLHMGHYQPLSWLTFGMDYLVWGINPVGYHLTNVLLHAANSVLFYFVILQLFSLTENKELLSNNIANLVAAGFGALFFAIHPLRVESVAWATERRDVLSGLFFLLTILSYLKANALPEIHRHSRCWLMLGTFVFYVCALLSKAITVTIPVVMLILDAYPLKRLGGSVFYPRVKSREVWLEKIPFFLLAVIVGMNAIFAQRGAGLKSIESYDPLDRLAQAVFGIVFYIWKTVFPFGLSPLYEIPLQLDPLDWPFALSGIAVLTITVSLSIIKTAWPAGIAAWLYYLVVVFPMLGITQSGPQMVADRYSYLSCLGWAALAAVALRYLLYTGTKFRFGEKWTVVTFGTAAVILFVLGTLTWKQIPVWRNSESLWRHAIAVGHGSSTVYYNLAYILHKQGNLDSALDHYRKSLSFNPNMADTHYYLADVLAAQGAVAEATQHYQQAIRIRPSFWGAYYNLALALERQEKFDEAIQRYREAIQINSTNPNLHNSLAMALLKSRERERERAKGDPTSPL